MSDIREILSRLVGEERAKRVLGEDYDSRTVYGLPVNKKGQYTPYTRENNLNSNPSRYLGGTTAKVVFDPSEDVSKRAPGANAYYDAFDTVHFPSHSTPADSPRAFNSKQLYELVHELQHAREKVTHSNPERNVYKTDDGLLESIREKIKSHYNAPKVDSERPAANALTLQELRSEQLPQLMQYESQLRPGQSLFQSGLGKLFTPEEKAMYLRRTDPLPPGIDGMVK